MLGEKVGLYGHPSETKSISLFIFIYLWHGMVWFAMVWILWYRMVMHCIMFSCFVLLYIYSQVRS